MTQSGLIQNLSGLTPKRCTVGKEKREIGGVYLSRWGSASLHPLLPLLMSSEAESCDCNTSLHLTRDELQINGGNGATEGALEREANGGWRGELLKKACQNNENKWRWSLLRWRGELHLWGVFASILLHRSKSSVCRPRGASTTHGRGKLRTRKMRALIVIIVQGQLFPRWSKSCWYVLACGWEGGCWM